MLKIIYQKNTNIFCNFTDEAFYLKIEKDLLYIFLLNLFLLLFAN